MCFCIFWYMLGIRLVYVLYMSLLLFLFFLVSHFFKNIYQTIKITKKYIQCIYQIYTTKLKNNGFWYALVWFWYMYCRYVLLICIFWYVFRKKERLLNFYVNLCIYQTYVKTYQKPLFFICIYFWNMYCIYGLVIFIFRYIFLKQTTNTYNTYTKNIPNHTKKH